MERYPASEVQILGGAVLKQVTLDRREGAMGMSDAELDAMNVKLKILCGQIEYLRQYADATFARWDADEDSAVGKRLRAMAGDLPGYDKGLDEIFPRS